MEENKEGEEIIVKRLEPNQISENDEFINFKIIIVGNSGVGKSCFLKIFITKKWRKIKKEKK